MRALQLACLAALAVACTDAPGPPGRAGRRDALARAAGASGEPARAAAARERARATLAAVDLTAEASRFAGSPPDGRPHVVFDQSMQPLSSPLDWAFDGMSLLSASLRAHGASVSINNHDLERVLPAWGRPGVVLVLGIPWGKRYSPAARAAIDAFLRAGGGVLVISEHDNAFGNGELQNELTERYGTTTLPVHTTQRNETSSDRRGYWPFADAAAWGLRGVRLYLPAPLRLRAPARPLLRIVDPVETGAGVVASLARVGAGRLAVLSDVELLWNMTPDTGLREGGNEAFLLRLFGELAGTGAALSPSAPPELPAPLREGERCVLFERAGAGFYPELAPSGLFAFARVLAQHGLRATQSHEGTDYTACELVALIAPLSPLPLPPRFFASRKLLLVGDGATNMLEVSPNPWGRLPGVRYSEDPQARPLRVVLAQLGLEVLPVTLLDADDGYAPAGRLSTSGEGVHLHRAAALAWRDWVYEPVVIAPDARPTEDLIPATPAYGPGAAAEPLPRRVVSPLVQAQRAPLVVAAKSPRVFVVSDYELLTDQELAFPEGSRLLAELLAWLDD